MKIIYFLTIALFISFVGFAQEANTKKVAQQTAENETPKHNSDRSQNYYCGYVTLNLSENHQNTFTNTIPSCIGDPVSGLSGNTDLPLGSSLGTNDQPIRELKISVHKGLTAVISGMNSAYVGDVQKYSGEESESSYPITNYEWYIKGSWQSTGRNPSISVKFDTSGDYIIKLRITDTHGSVSSDTKKVIVTEYPEGWGSRIIIGPAIYPECSNGYTPNWPAWKWGTPIHSEIFYMNTTNDSCQGNAVYILGPGEDSTHNHSGNPEWTSYAYHTPHNYPTELAKIAKSHNMYFGAEMWNWDNNVQEAKDILGGLLIGPNRGEVTGYLYQWESEADKAGIQQDCISMREAYNQTLNVCMRNVQAGKMEDKGGLPFVFLDSGAGIVNVEMAAGYNGAWPEAFFKNTMMYIVFNRGTSKAYNRKVWGIWNAWEWQTLEIDLPPAAPDGGLRLLKAGIIAEWMSGAGIMWLESGNYYVNTCDRNGKRYSEYTLNGNTVTMYEAPVTKHIRDTWAECYSFVKNTPHTIADPEVNFAIVEGQYDGYIGWFEPNTPIWAQWKNGPEWNYGNIEHSWDYMYNVFMTEVGSVDGHPNRWLSGFPYGQFDVLPIDVADQNVLNDYNALIFLGWNTMDKNIYSKLITYASNGGRILIAVPQFNVDRDYDRKEVVNLTYDAMDLLNHGDLTALCGVTVTGKGSVPDSVVFKTNSSYYEFPDEGTSYAIGGSHAYLANVDIANSNTTHVLAADASDHPILIEHKIGSGYVYLLTTWCYSGERELNSIMIDILKAVGKKERGDIYISEQGSEEPGANADAICWAYAPADSNIYLVNCDMDNPHSVDLHLDGITMSLTIQPDGKIVTIPYVLHKR